MTPSSSPGLLCGFLEERSFGCPCGNLLQSPPPPATCVHCAGVSREHDPNKAPALDSPPLGPLLGGLQTAPGPLPRAGQELAQTLISQPGRGSRGQGHQRHSGSTRHVPEPSANTQAPGAGKSFILGLGHFSGWDVPQSCAGGQSVAGNKRDTADVAQGLASLGLPGEAGLGPSWPGSPGPWEPRAQLSVPQVPRAVGGGRVLLCGLRSQGG